MDKQLDKQLDKQFDNHYQDIFTFVNKEWINKTEIPNNKTEVTTFTQLTDHIYKIQFDILNNMKTENHPLGKLFDKLMDIENIESFEKNMLLNYVQFIRTHTSINKVFSLLGSFNINLINDVIGISSLPDFDNPKINRLMLTHGNLLLGNKLYYKHYNRNTDQFKIKLQDHVKKIFDYIEDENVVNISHFNCANNTTFVDFLFASINRHADENRNVDKLYVTMDINDFIANVSYGYYDLIEGWKCYFKSLSINENIKITIIDLQYFKKLSFFLMIIPNDVILDYISYIFIKYVGNISNISIQKLLYEFYDASILKQREITPKHIRIINILNDNFAEVIGIEYSKKYFDQPTYQYITKMIDIMKSELIKLLNKCTWMASTTKENAVKKVSNIKCMVGYPYVLKDMSRIYEVIDALLLEQLPINSIMLAVNRTIFTRDVLLTINAPIDRDIWEMGAHNVNAYYNPQLNCIVLPAGILQPPFFSINYDNCENLGGIGTIIGHELMHSFDDQGKKYDYTGAFKTWWNEQDSEKFNKVEQLMSKQVENEFGSYVARLTLGENLADIGGLNLAYNTLNCYYNNNNLTKDIKQKFFLKYASIWKSKYTECKLKHKKLTDVHCNGQHRANIVKNIDDFYKVFDSYKFANTMFIDPTSRVKIFS